MHWISAYVLEMNQIVTNMLGRQARLLKSEPRRWFLLAERFQFEVCIEVVMPTAVMKKPSLMLFCNTRRSLIAY